MLRLQAYTTMSGFMQCLRWNSGHCACQASTLPTEPHRQSTTSVFFFFINKHLSLSHFQKGRFFEICGIMIHLEKITYIRPDHGPWKNSKENSRLFCFVLFSTTHFMRPAHCGVHTGCNYMCNPDVPQWLLLSALSKMGSGKAPRPVGPQVPSSGARNPWGTPAQ